MQEEWKRMKYKSTCNLINETYIEREAEDEFFLIMETRKFLGGWSMAECLRDHWDKQEGCKVEALETIQGMLGMLSRKRC